MKGSTLGIIIGIGLLTLGAGWLLDTLGKFPQIEWLWTIGLAVSGVLVLVFGGMNKVTVVLGPSLMSASALSTLEQLGYLEEKFVEPIMICTVGLLLLLVFLLPVPTPEMFKRVERKQ